MSEKPRAIRGSGDYATYEGGQYFADCLRDQIWLFSNDDPLPAGFSVSSYEWVRGEKLVPLSDITSLVRVETTCVWRGHHFRVGIISGGAADMFYLGKMFDEVSDLPGMERPDKYEVLGRVPVSELTDVTEVVVDVPLGHHSQDPQNRGSA